MKTIIQGWQNFCDITIRDTDGRVIPLAEPEAWDVKLISRSMRGTAAEFTAEPPVDENATFRIFISEEITAGLAIGQYSLQIKARYQGQRGAIDIAVIRDFINVEQSGV